MDGALIAVPIEAGEHTVKLEFFPAGLKAGLAFTLSGALLFAIMILFTCHLRKKRVAAENITE